MHVLVIGQIQADQEKYVLSQLDKQTYKGFSIHLLIDEKPAKGINARRKKIVHNHKMLTETIRYKFADYIIQIEGDSELPADCFERLIERLDQIPAEDFGWLSGVQVGRHGLYCIGAWNFIDKDHFSSIGHTLKGIQKVDATGFYCLISPKQVWLQGIASWNEERWGPDVNWGLSLKNKGYRAYVDMDLEIGHKSTDGIIGLDNLNLCTANFYKENNQWKYKVID